MTPPDGRLPHTYPFRFADRVVERTGPAEGRVLAAVTAGARGLNGAGSPLLLGELIAQAALLLSGGDPESFKGGFLAGISGFSVERSPEPGDLLTVDVKLAARLGPVVRFEGVIRDGEGRRVASGAVTVRQPDGASLA